MDLALACDGWRMLGWRWGTAGFSLVLFPVAKNITTHSPSFQLKLRAAAASSRKSEVPQGCPHLLPDQGILCKMGVGTSSLIVMALGFCS